MISQEWYSSLNKSGSRDKVSDSSKSEEDFVTASECTCTPPSRSSSFHTASEGEPASPWWEVDPSDQEHEASAPTLSHDNTDTKVKLQLQSGCGIHTNTKLGNNKFKERFTTMNILYRDTTTV